MSYLKQNRIPAWVDTAQTFRSELLCMGQTVTKDEKTLQKHQKCLKKLKIKQREDTEANTERKR